MRLIHTTLCTAIACTAIACGDSGESPSPTPAPAPAAEEPAPAPPAPPPPPAAEPVADTGPGDPTAGHAQYKIFCATCHGEDGCGDGPGAAGLDPKPAKHCDGNYMNALSDEHLFKVVKEGGVSVGKSPLMAPWGGTLSDDQIRDVVAFVRSIAVPPYEAAGK